MKEAIKLRIEGRVISKKNSRQLAKRGGFMMNIPSKAFTNFENSALPQLMTQYRGEPISSLLKVSYIFHLKGKLDTDIDNMQAGINDILQKAGVIADDKQIIEVHAWKIAGSTEWRTEVSIEEL